MWSVPNGTQAWGGGCLQDHGEELETRCLCELGTVEGFCTEEELLASISKMLHADQTTCVISQAQSRFPLGVHASDLPLMVPIVKLVGLPLTLSTSAHSVFHATQHRGL